MAGSGASRIQKPCDACKRYLDHLDGKNQNVRCFLSTMTASSGHRMVVPKRFLKHFDGQLSGIIKLESPDHGSYDVEVTKHSHKVVFQHGWGEFVESHHIKENDSLLFRHIERSSFEVLIFDSDGCEKVFSCAGIRGLDYIDISNSSHHETTESSASERFVRREKGTSRRHGKVAKRAAKFSSSSESGEDIPSENNSFELDDLQTPHRQDYVLSRRNFLSEAQEKRVIALIQEIQPESTAFVAVMRKSHIEPPHPYLVISKEYALAYFPLESMDVTLQRPGMSKMWHPILQKRKDGRIYMLRGHPWMDFVLDNDVQEGDICLFLPTTAGRRSTFTVYLIQATSTCSRVGSGKKGSLSHQKKTPKKDATSSLYEESGEDCLSGYESTESDHVKAFSERNYVLSARCHLTAEQEEKIVALVKKVQPEIPFLVIQVKKSNVNRLRSNNLVIRKGYAAQHFPQESQFITLERPGGKKWRNWLHVKPGGRGYMLTTRWQNFIRDNHLRSDDICLFQPMPSKKGFKVMVHLLSDPSTHCSFSSSESGEDIPSEKKSFELDDLETPLRQDYVLSQKNFLSESQEKRVIALIQEIQPVSTAFVAVMRKSHVEPPHPYLVISKKYALAHFPHESTDVTLQRPDKSKKWHPIFYKRTDGVYMLKGQWMDFVLDNDVQEGDICLFLPTTAGRRSTFTVRLIQATSNCSRVGSGKRGSLSHQTKTPKKAATSSLYEGSGEDSLSGYKSIQSDHVKAFSERNYVLSARCHLTAEQEEKIVALVKKVQPEIPFLVIQVKKSNVRSNNLAICKGYAAQHFPQESQTITLERPGGKNWHNWLHVRSGGSGYMLTMRWQNFVRDNHLQSDDICLFQPMPSKKGFRVMVHLLSEPSTRSSSSGGPAHGLNRHINRGMTSTAHVHEKPGSENSGSLDLHKYRAVQQGHQVLSDCGGPSSSKPPLYMVLGGTCLTPAQDKVVQGKAMAIKSEVSIFVATMNKKILGYNNEAFILDFSDAAEYLPDGQQALMLLRQGQTRVWCTNVHNRLLLATAEWREFVCDSGLEDGDICLFEPMKNLRVAMLVHIIRSKQYF